MVSMANCETVLDVVRSSYWLNRGKRDSAMEIARLMKALGSIEDAHSCVRYARIFNREVLYYAARMREAAR